MIGASETAPVPLMTEADRAAFGESWSLMMEGQAGDRQITEDARIRVANDSFRLLQARGYTLGEVQAALDAHRFASVFVAKVADVVRIIEGELPGVDTLKALALDRDHPTPLGIMVRRLVGEHLMTTGDDYAVTAAIRGKAAKLDAFRKRVLVGEHEEDELRLIVGAGCRPSGEIAPGVPGCRAPFVPALEREFRRLLSEKKLAGPAPAATPGHVPEPTPEERTQSEKAKAEAMALIRGLAMTTPDPAAEAAREASLRRDGERESA